MKQTLVDKKRRKKRRKEFKVRYGLSVATIERYGFKMAIKVYDECNRKCLNCGGEDDLTIHHLDNKGRNYQNKGLKANNNLDNLIVLCRKCHGGLHSIQYWNSKK